jgi:hypothetical protein
MTLSSPFQSGRASLGLGGMPPYSKKLLKDISSIYAKSLNTTSSLSMIGVLGTLNNFYQATHLVTHEIL